MAQEAVDTLRWAFDKVVGVRVRVTVEPAPKRGQIASE